MQMRIQTGLTPRVYILYDVKNCVVLLQGWEVVYILLYKSSWFEFV